MKTTELDNSEDIMTFKIELNEMTKSQDEMYR